MALQTGDYVRVQLASGRLVNARVVKAHSFTPPLLSWGGLRPFHGYPLTSQEVLAIEAGR